MTDLTQAARGPNRRRVLLAGGAIVLAGAGVAAGRFFIRPNYDGRALTPNEAHSAALNGNALLVYIRRPDEWRRTGVGAGSHPLDMRRGDFAEALTALADGDRSAPIALICAGGVRSARLSRHLTEAGFTQIIDVPEGMLGSSAGPGWLRRGLPVTEWRPS